MEGAEDQAAKAPGQSCERGICKDLWAAAVDEEVVSMDDGGRGGVLTGRSRDLWDVLLLGRLGVLTFTKIAGLSASPVSSGWYIMALMMDQSCAPFLKYLLICTLTMG